MIVLTYCRKYLVDAFLVLVLIVNGAAWYMVSYYSDPHLEITFLDVGQGDAFIVSTPDRVNMLVDAGKGDSAITLIEENIHWLETVDIIMLSHPDADHVGNLAYVIDNYDVDIAFVNNIEHENEGYRNLKSKEGSVQMLLSKRGDQFRLGCCVTMDILWPEEDENIDVNDLSTTFLLKYGNFKMISGGDLSAELEEKVLDGYDANSIDLLKVNHHGSKTSTSEDFLKQIVPVVSVIQVGVGNQYGHPHRDVISNLNDIGTNIYRTDYHGQIVYSTDGHTYNVSTFTNE